MKISVPRYSAFRKGEVSAPCVRIQRLSDPTEPGFNSSWHCSWMTGGELDFSEPHARQGRGLTRTSQWWLHRSSAQCGALGPRRQGAQLQTHPSVSSHLTWPVAQPHSPADDHLDGLLGDQWEAGCSSVEEIRHQGDVAGRSAIKKA